MEATDQIDRLIEKRQAKQTGADEANAVEAMWRAGERAHAAKQREENRTAWFAYFSHLAHSCRQRAEEYEAKADALLDQSKGEDAA